MSKVVGSKGPGDARRPRPGQPQISRAERGNFPREVVSELRKTTWPTRDELMRMTGVVIVTVLIFAGLIGVADLLLGKAAGNLYTSATANATARPTPIVAPASSAAATIAPSPSVSAAASASAHTTPTTTAGPTPVK